MQFTSPQRVLKVSRLVGLYGLLAGLLFSCGEGIRLLPFAGTAVPAITEATGERHVFVEYQKNILRISKPGKNDWTTADQQALIAGAVGYSHFDYSPAFVFVETPIGPVSEPIRTTIFGRSIKGRAPPVA